MAVVAVVEVEVAVEEVVAAVAVAARHLREQVEQPIQRLLRVPHELERAHQQRRVRGGRAQHRQRRRRRRQQRRAHRRALTGEAIRGAFARQPLRRLQNLPEVGGDGGGGRGGGRRGGGAGDGDGDVVGGGVLGAAAHLALALVAGVLVVGEFVVGGEHGVDELLGCVHPEAAGVGRVVDIAVAALFFETNEARSGQHPLEIQKALGERRRRHLHAALVGAVDLQVVAVGAVQPQQPAHLVARVQHRTEARPQRLGLRLAQSGELAAPF